MSLLDVIQVNRSFGGLRAVQEVSFGVEQNMIKAIIGPNGAGKTTLFNLISGTLAPDSGTVQINGTHIQGQPPYRIALQGISRTFQNVKLFSHMTVLENVMVGRHIRSRAGFASAMLRLPHTGKEERAIREKSMELLRMLGLHDQAEQEAASLPFGKQRIVEFGRALATEPSLLLLDEPAAGLNIYETAQISELIMKIRGQGITVLVIEHDMSLVMNISDEIVVLSSGSKIAEGTPDEIQKNGEVIRVYLGEENA
ncbi:MAG: high-affinity branched-chain amino acid ABC transporter ATP-binding protein LivG [Spirochaetes bacterium RBG_16_49_21]|nr:MAG: high-affinity branched-chain amino acid ABC transporter ATP-binding protein LivG [Spirochaetes bacterium RBG_16_49_21]